MKATHLFLYAALATAASTAHAYDSCPVQVTRHNSSSWLIVQPRVHNLYLGDYFNNGGYTSRQGYENAISYLANLPAFWARLSEYGILGGSWGGSVTSPAGWVNTSGNYDDSWFTAEISQRINDGSLTYYGDNNDLYVVYLPPGIGSTGDVVNGSVFYGGHHDAYNDYYGRKIWYAIVESGQNTGLVTHEIVEAATDPNGDGYYSAQGLEIGDLCDSPPMLFNWPGTGYVVEGVFSEAICACFAAVRPAPVDPCAKRPPAQRLCCKKPWLPVCSDGT